MANHGMMWDTAIALASGYLEREPLDPTSRSQAMASGCRQQTARERRLTRCVAYDVVFERYLSGWDSICQTVVAPATLSAGFH